MSNWIYGSLFAGSFLSATLLPGSSEAMLVGLLLAGKGQAVTLTAVAAVANTLGGVTNIVIGRLLPLKNQGRWHHTATRWLGRFGPAALLLSWLPVIGDPLCVLAGWLRLPWLATLIFLTVGKTLRYIVLTVTTIQGMAWWH